MVRFRVVRYLSALIPFVITLASPLSEPLKRQFISRYDLRWFAPGELSGRYQTIAVYNAGSAELPKVTIELNVQADSAGAVSDFTFSPTTDGPRISFLNSLSDSEGLNHLSVGERDQISTIMDEHSTVRSLYALDKILDDNLILKLKTTKAFAQLTDASPMKGSNCNDWHMFWLQKCGVNRPPNPICSQVNKMLERWEQSKRGLYGSAAKKWMETTGVMAILPSGQVSSVGKTFFSLPLSAGESGYLTIRYGPDPINSISTSVSSSIVEKAFRVEDLDDLRASPMLIFVKDHPFLTAIFAVALVLSLLVAWHVIKPNKLRPIHRIFNLALQTGDHEFWEHAYQRHRYFVRQQYKHFREIFNKPNLNLETEEVMDKVRASLIERYEVNRKPFKNEENLNRYIRTQIRFLVLDS